MENLAQYLNYFFGTVIAQGFENTPDCIPSTSCNDIICTLPTGGYYRYGLLNCQTPPALHLLAVLPNGTIYYQHVTNHSEILSLPPRPEVTLNITFKKIDPSTIGLAVSKLSSHWFAGVYI